MSNQYNISVFFWLLGRHQTRNWLIEKCLFRWNVMLTKIRKYVVYNKFEKSKQICMILKHSKFAKKNWMLFNTWLIYLNLIRKICPNYLFTNHLDYTIVILLFNNLLKITSSPHFQENINTRDVVWSNSYKKKQLF